MRLLLFFLIFMAAIALGIALHADSGYVIIAFKTWTIEMPLWFVIISGLLLFIVYNILRRLFHNLYVFPHHLIVKIRFFFRQQRYQNRIKHLMNQNEIYDRAKLLILSNQKNSAERKLRRALKKQWSSSLLQLYSL